MKYYAVTEDPNELMHYGRLGMKWGQHIFGGTKSLAYKRASKKLSRSMKNGIKKAQTNWKNASKNIQKRIDNHAERSLQKQIKKAESLSKLAPIYEQNRMAKEARQNDKRILRAARKDMRNEAKSEKRFNKYMQEAREGRLRYGKLTDDQVRKVTERLALERNARVLGNTEKPKFKKQIATAIREGTLQGLTKGTAAMFEEVGRAAAINGIKNRKNRKALKNKAKFEDKIKRERDEKNRENQIKLDKKFAKDEAQAEVSREYYKAKAETGKHAMRVTKHGRNVAYAKLQQDKKNKAKIEEFEKERMRLANAAYLKQITGEKGGSGKAVDRYKALAASMDKKMPRQKRKKSKYLQNVSVYDLLYG